MHKLHFSIHINASREKVWNTMLKAETYQEWTKPFSPEPNQISKYVGNWEEDSEIKFIGTDESGKDLESGMYARIKENRLHEFISIEHVGIIKDGVVDTTSEEVKKWIPAFENYMFKDADGGTDVLVDIDVPEEYKDFFEEAWPKALNLLKELAEK
jgi:L-rhamnose mutarotase